MDLVLGRVTLTDSQRRNTFDYLNSESSISLSRKFEIPPINFLTLADSEYVGGLEIAHVLADVLKEQLNGTITPAVKKEVSNFMRIEPFTGHSESPPKWFGGNRPP
ncbi:MAG: hypothetical protein HYX85_01165 [Chloroflexi bacterium]|nr:hypothetical protein [Chloroflexota bacterium]